MNPGDLVTLRPQYVQTALYDEDLSIEAARVQMGEIMVFLSERAIRETGFFASYARVLLTSGRVGYVRTSALDVV